MTDDFYDELAPLYHLIYPDWNESIRLQGDKLSQLIEAEWPGGGAHRKVLDVSCGIGTQALGLAALGHVVTASDLSANEIERARHEANCAASTSLSRCATCARRIRTTAAASTS